MDALMNRYLERVVKFLNTYEDEEAVKTWKEKFGEDVVSVTDIAAECLRVSYFNKKYGQRLSLEKTNVLFLGKALHQLPLLDKRELVLGWNGIVGVIDDYGELEMNGRKYYVLIDKKFGEYNLSRKTKANEHHIRQVLYYSVLLRENGFPVDKIFIMYVNPHERNGMPVFIEVKQPLYEAIKSEMLERRKILVRALRDGVPPPRNIGWMCRYCEWVQECFGDGHGRDNE